MTDIAVIRDEAGGKTVFKFQLHIDIADVDWRTAQASFADMVAEAVRLEWLRLGDDLMASCYARLMANA